MGNVFLFIDGLSASYHKGGVWNVVFPCDLEGNHRVLFGYQKQNGTIPNAPIPLIDKEIQIVTDNAVRPDKHQSNNFDLVLDLTSDDFHKEGVRFIKNPKIKKSVMTVENALFYPAETKKRNNYVENLTAGTPRKPIRGEAASLIGVNIELNAGGSVTVKVDGVAGFPMTFEDGDFLYIDNDCAGCTPFDTDFELFQKIFENSSDATIKFKMLSYSLTHFSLNKSSLSHVFAGSPPAFCDGFQIGKTGDL